MYFSPLNTGMPIDTVGRVVTGALPDAMGPEPPRRRQARPSSRALVSAQTDAARAGSWNEPESALLRGAHRRSSTRNLGVGGAAPHTVVVHDRRPPVRRPVETLLQIHALAGVE